MRLVITKFNDGEKFKLNKNGKPYIRVSGLVANGAYSTKRTALHNIDESLLDFLADARTLDELYGSPQNQHIVREESFEPFYDNDQAVINPETKEVMSVAGQDVYRADTLYPVALGMVDDLILNAQQQEAATVASPSASAEAAFE